ncbi:nuclease-related domain-containing protein, partial [Microcoleus sp. AR_TQ3_B6]|uniref:nuclease-related domain-containing protein n=1 Tax=Microcoleus sp. AR_TQ3_B6 TaxID=3055284 RepID=UPI002FD1870E
EEGRRKKEEGRRKKEEGRRKKEEGRKIIRPFLIVNSKCIGAFMQPQYNEGAGKQLRREAQQLRTKALYRYGAATGLVLLPLLVYAVAHFDPLFLLVALLIGVLTAPLLIPEGNRLWNDSKKYYQGADGEEKTQQVLEPLIQSGWMREYNLILPHVGDIDVWLRSPKGSNFILEVKSHPTVVVLDGDVLKNQSSNGKWIDFEKDFLEQIGQQKKAIKKAKKLTKVTGVVVFSRAQVNLSNKKKIRGAYVMALGDLVSRLQELDRTYQSR